MSLQVVRGGGRRGEDTYAMYRVTTMPTSNLSKLIQSHFLSSLADFIIHHTLGFQCQTQHEGAVYLVMF